MLRWIASALALLIATPVLAQPKIEGDPHGDDPVGRARMVASLFR